MNFTYDFAKIIEGENMNIAQNYFQEQLVSDKFRHVYLEEKVKLDIEYQLEELKKFEPPCSPYHPIYRK